MTDHVYKVGQNVRLLASTIHQGMGGVYEISALLPDERGEPQYRLRSATLPQQRVVRENQIVPL